MASRDYHLFYIVVALVVMFDKISLVAIANFLCDSRDRKLDREFCWCSRCFKNMLGASCPWFTWDTEINAFVFFFFSFFVYLTNGNYALSSASGIYQGWKILHIQGINERFESSWTKTARCESCCIKKTKLLKCGEYFLSNKLAERYITSYEKHNAIHLRQGLQIVSLSCFLWQLTYNDIVWLLPYSTGKIQVRLLRGEGGGLFTRIRACWEMGVEE